MNDDCCPAGNKNDTKDTLICPECESGGRSVSHETLYHQLKPFEAREVTSNQIYGVCRERSCPVLYFSSDHNQVWKMTNVRNTVGFKQPEDEPPHPVCYCFGYTEEKISEEIEETGKSTVVEWITERVQDEECACEYRNPTGQCCLGDVKECVTKFTS